MLDKMYFMFMTGRFNIVITSILSKLIYRFNAISNKIPRSYFVALITLFNNLYRNAEDQDEPTQCSRITKVGGLTLLNFKTMKLEQSREGSTSKTIDT